MALLTHKQVAELSERAYTHAVGEVRKLLDAKLISPLDFTQIILDMVNKKLDGSLLQSYVMHDGFDDACAACGRPNIPFTQASQRLLLGISSAIFLSDPPMLRMGRIPGSPRRPLAAVRHSTAGG
jgi:hypothetical protein